MSTYNSLETYGKRIFNDCYAEYPSIKDDPNCVKLFYFIDFDNLSSQLDSGMDGVERVNGNIETGNLVSYFLREQIKYILIKKDKNDINTPKRNLIEKLETKYPDKKYYIAFNFFSKQPGKHNPSNENYVFKFNDRQEVEIINDEIELESIDASKFIFDVTMSYTGIYCCDSSNTISDLFKSSLQITDFRKTIEGFKNRNGREIGQDQYGQCNEVEIAKNDEQKTPSYYPIHPSVAKFYVESEKKQPILSSNSNELHSIVSTDDALLMKWYIVHFKKFYGNDDTYFSIISSDKFRGAPYLDHFSECEVFFRNRIDNNFFDQNEVSKYFNCLRKNDFAKVINYLDQIDGKLCVLPFMERTVSYDIDKIPTFSNHAKVVESPVAILCDFNLMKDDR